MLFEVVLITGEHLIVDVESEDVFTQDFITCKSALALRMNLTQNNQPGVALLPLTLLGDLERAQITIPRIQIISWARITDLQVTKMYDEMLQTFKTLKYLSPGDLEMLKNHDDKKNSPLDA